MGASDIAPDDEFVVAISKEAEAIKKLYYDAFNTYRNAQEISEKNLHQRGKRVFDSF